MNQLKKVFAIVLSSALFLSLSACTGKQTAYNDFFSEAKEGAAIPGLEKGFAPQGLSYIPAMDWFLITNYGDDGNESYLTVIDAETNTLIKTLNIMNTDNTPFNGHCGGVTVSTQNIWIASEGRMYRIPVADIVTAADNSSILFADSFLTPSDASFAYYADGVLWSGEFYEAKNYPTDKSHYLKTVDATNHAVVSGYKLDPATDLLPSGKITDANTVVTPDCLLSIPDKIQGIAVLSDGNLVLSQSYGRQNDSTLYTYKSVLSENSTTAMNITGTDVPTWVLNKDSLISKLEAPPMTEGVIEKEPGSYIVLFESGANKYSDGKYPLKNLYEVTVSN